MHKGTSRSGVKYALISYTGFSQSYLLFKTKFFVICKVKELKHVQQGHLKKIEGHEDNKSLQVNLPESSSLVKDGLPRYLQWVECRTEAEAALGGNHPVLDSGDV